MVVGLGLALGQAACAMPSHYRPLNEQPMFGGQAKTPQEIEADRRFVEGMRREGTPRENVDRLIARAYDYIRAGDHATAMKRANQAWLLLPEDGKVQHLFAVIMDLRGDLPATIDPFWQRAAKTQMTDALFARDWSLFNCRHGRREPCIVLLQHGYRVDPTLKEWPLYFAQAHYYNRDYAQAWRAVAAAEQQGLDPTERFLKALSEKMPRPK